ncbi:hypothetical protein [Vaginella massiliensis]|uniref:hypothetical protein n=1 Tax=Vaginella massiliensis TaxID=1816680 RepID=UPI0008388E9F|nr:hypothetical protein [Vaginella massiliensis]
MKNVLVIYYSQSGQLKEIADSVSLPFVEDPTYQVDFYNIQMENDFPFPWDKEQFFGVFPDSFLQNPHPFHPPNQKILTTDYDLILLHYQVWYLSPSIPINSFLKSKFAFQLLQGKPVVTISGSRNMWVYAQEKIKRLLLDNQAILVGNIALTDRNINLVSVVTVVDWMFSGVKRKPHGFFPMPGVAEHEIKAAKKFGAIIKKHSSSEDYRSLQQELIENNAVEIRWFLVSMDKKANRLFSIWANLFQRNPHQKTRLIKLFHLYLLVVIWMISPIVHLVETIFYPFFYYKIQKQKRYYQRVEHQ